MVINSIELQEGINMSKDEFSNKFNLLTSQQQNSVGKSTYCRLIFHSLGFAIPATEGIAFNKVFSKIDLTERSKHFIITREGQKLIVSIPKENFTREYSLPEQHESFLSFLFNSDNIRVLKNVLGLLYIDQEKGWTLLNRGKVIGNNRFSIDEIIGGLKNIDCEELFQQREVLEAQIEKYNSLLSLDEIKTRYFKENNNLELSNMAKEIQKDIASVQFSIDEINKKIKEIDRVIKQDSLFFDYIESMNLYVKTPSGTIRISKDNIENSSNIEYLMAQKSILVNERFDLEIKKSNLVKNYEKVAYGTDLLNENLSVDVEKGVNLQLSNLNLDISTITKLLEENRKELRNVNGRIKDRLRYSNEYITEIYNRFKENATILGVEKSISEKADYIFTSDLKSRTGANFQKLILAYKVAIIQVVETIFGTKLFLVIDSPKSKELDNSNTKKIMDFLKNKLCDNQVIVASIYSAEQLFTDFEKTIIIKNKAIETR